MTKSVVHVYGSPTEEGEAVRVLEEDEVLCDEDTPFAEHESDPVVLTVFHLRAEVLGDGRGGWRCPVCGELSSDVPTGTA